MKEEVLCLFKGKGDTMFSIAICDDDNILCSEIENIILEYSKLSLEKIEVTIFLSGEELCAFMRRGEKFDLLFLDIELRALNGVMVGRTIREEMKNELIKIVYISAKTTYCEELFQIRPMNFLRKPIEPKKIISNIEKAVELSGILDHVFTYQVNKITCKAQVKEIMYFESLGRQIKMVTEKEEILLYGNIKKIFQEMKQYHFIFVHQSFLVNYAYVTKFSGAGVMLTNQEILPMSKHRREAVMEFVEKYKLGEEWGKNNVHTV